MNVDMSLEDIEKEKIRSFIIPGGNISEIDNVDVILLLKLQRNWIYLRAKKTCRKQSTFGNIIIESNRTNSSLSES